MSVFGGNIVDDAAASDRPRQFVVAAMRGALGFDDSVRSQSCPALTEPEAIAVAEITIRNKIGGLVRSGAIRASLPLPDTLNKMLKAQQAKAIAKNLVNLVETEKVSNLLHEKNIDLIIIKGPTRSFDLFGSLDCRTSNDIDILVRPEDYLAAGELLCHNDYRRGVSTEDQWWHDHLGESPFIPDNGQCVIDIHNKVQQPGGPSPRSIKSFFESARDISVAGRSFKVLCLHDALLLSYISASKALRGGEFWLAYAAEIAVSRRLMTAQAFSEFQVVTKRQGLSRMVDHIDRVVDCIFALSAAEKQMSMYGRSVTDLAALPFGNGQSAGRRFHRSRLLWVWTDGAVVYRAAGFAKLVTELMVSDIRRVRESEKSAANPATSMFPAQTA